MRKIPTLFLRNPENLRELLPQVHPDCGWVIAGEGVPTRKYDGTCVMFDGERWWSRREVKPDKNPPPNFVPLDYDDTTGKTVGWEPVEQSSFAKVFALTEHDYLSPGTFELIGPKVNGNPERVDHHVLLRHEDAKVIRFMPGEPITLESMRAFLTGPDWPGFEGIVWHHPDGRMAKIKRRDFPKERR